MSEIDVSIIIVNYNTKQLLKNCITSIYEKTENISYEIIVSDNGSEDGSLKMLQEDYPDVIIIDNKINYGFGKANNIGAKYAHGKYLLFLNSDTLLCNNAIKLFFECDKKDDYLLGSFLLNEKNQITWSYGNFEKPFTEIKRLQLTFFPRWIIKKQITKVEKRKCNEGFYKPEEIIVDFISGADLFISRKIFTELNGFDENIFMYYEDNDLCRRAYNSGYKSFLITTPKITHLEGKSSKSSANKQIIKETSLIYYIKKYSSSKNRFSSVMILFKILAIFRFFSFNYTVKEKIQINRQLFKNIHLLMKENI